MSRRGLQILLIILGAVAVAAGGVTVLGGPDTVLAGGKVSATVASELRFYAAWYVAAGVLVLRAVPRVESERNLIRIVSASFFFGGIGRLISLLTEGGPHVFFVALMSIELAIPFVVVPWQGAIAKADR